MKILRLVLQNFKGIYDGLGRKKIEIDFPVLQEDPNKITMLIGKNGTGKSVILSHMSPFFETNDVRDGFKGSILETESEAYKEITIKDHNDIYVIKHFWKNEKVRSYFERNGEELNSNGGIRSFKALVDEHLGLTSEFFKVGRIGSNVGNFIDLNSSDRKRYISNFVPDIDPYLQVNKIVTTLIGEDRRVITYLSDELNKLKSLEEIENEIKTRNGLLDTYNLQLEKLRNDKAAVVAKKELADKHLEESGFDPQILQNIEEIELAIEKTKQGIIDLQTSYPTLSEIDNFAEKIEETRTKISELENQISSESSSKNSLSGSITLLKSDISNKTQDLNSLNLSFTQINTLQADIDSKQQEFDSMSESLESLKSKYEAKFEAYTYSEISNLDTVLINLGERISHAAGLVDKSTLTYLESLSSNQADIYEYLKSKVNHLTNQINLVLRERHVKEVAINTVKNNGENADVLKLRPSNCRIDTCGFISNALRYSKDLEKIPVLELELNSINEKHDTILNELNGLKSALSIIELLNDVSNRIKANLKLRHFAIFSNSDLKSLIKFISDGNYDSFKIPKDLITYSYSKQNIQTLSANLETLKAKLTSILDKQTYSNKVTEELVVLNDRLNALEENLFNVNNTLADLNAKATKRKKALNIYQSYNKLQEDLVRLNSEYDENSKLIESSKKYVRIQNEAKMMLIDLDAGITAAVASIKSITDEINDHRIKKTRYIEYVDQKKALEEGYNKLILIKEATDVTKGIPVKLIDSYLQSISTEANNLLNIAYRGNFNISFEVTDKDLSIPVTKSNGNISPDIAVTSQGQQAMTKTTLSLAIFKQVFKKYNILSLDEIDAELDSDNRKAFLDILNAQINELALEQVFVISHNNEFLTQKHINLILLPGHTAPINEAEFMNSKRIIADFS